MTNKPLEPNISLQFDLPDGHNIDGVRIDRSGWVAFLDKEGNEVEVSGVKRLVTHERKKGPKVRTKQLLDGIRLSIDGLQELCGYHDVFVIDTSYNSYPTARRYALACSLRLQFRPERSKVRVLVDENLVFYDLIRAVGNPERAGMAALVREHSRTIADLAMKRALVTDSDLGEHDLINARSVPLYGDVFLPPNFTLLYASSDTGTETTNRVLSFCDKQATAALRAMFAGEAAIPHRSERINGCGDLLVGRIVAKNVEATNTLIGRVTNATTATLILEGGGRREVIEVPFPRSLSPTPDNT